MSGPKVVRIVTREELVAICEGLLRRLDQAFAMWATEGKRIGELTDDEIATTLERKNALSHLLASDSFVDLQKSVPEEVAYLNGDLERRQQVAVDKAARRLTRRREARNSAATVLQALRSRGIEIPEALSANLRMVAEGNEMSGVDSVLAQAFTFLVPQESTGLTKAQKDLLDRHLTGLGHLEANNWKSPEIMSPFNVRLEQIDRKLAELKTQLNESQSADFAKRLASIEAKDSGPQQNLLMDSLTMDLVSAIDRNRVQRAALAELSMLAAEIGEISGTTDTLVRRVAACDSATSMIEINELANACRVSLSELQQQREAVGRRKAILSGLAKLGYEINEGMETAWAQDGHVIAKKSSHPGYGVEIGGQAHVGRLQVRTVALSSDRDVNRDRDAETIWCGEFSKLQGLLAESGDSLVIERSMGVGVVPLKEVSENSMGAAMESKGRTA